LSCLSTETIPGNLLYKVLSKSLNYPVDNRRLLDFGYNVGLEFEYNFGKVMGCNLGCSFLQTQYTYRIPSPWGDESTYVFNNLYLPIEINFNLRKDLPVQPSLKIGVAGVFQLSGRITGWIEPHPINTEIFNLSNELYFRCGIGLPVRFISRLKLSPCFYYQYNLTADDSGYFSRPHRFYDFLYTIRIFYIL